MAQLRRHGRKSCFAAAVTLAAPWSDWTDDELPAPDAQPVCVRPPLIFRPGDAVRVRNLTENFWHDGLVSAVEPLMVWLPEFDYNCSWLYVVPMPVDDGSRPSAPHCVEDNYTRPTECADLTGAISEELRVDGEIFGEQMWDLYRYVGLFYMFVALASIAVGAGFWWVALRGRDWKQSLTPQSSHKVMDLAIIKCMDRVRKLPMFVHSTRFIVAGVVFVAVVFLGLLFLAVRTQLYESSRLTDGQAAGGAAAFIAALCEGLVGNAGELSTGEVAVRVEATNPTYAELRVDDFRANVLRGGISVWHDQRKVLDDHDTSCFELLAAPSNLEGDFYRHLERGGGLLTQMRNVTGAAVVDVSFVVRGAWHGQTYEVRCSAAVPFSVPELEQYDNTGPRLKNLKTVKLSLLQGLRTFHERGDTVLNRRSLKFEGSAPGKVRLMWMGSVLALSLTMGASGCLCCQVVENRRLRREGDESAGLKDDAGPAPEKVPSDLRSAGQGDGKKRASSL